MSDMPTSSISSTMNFNFPIITDCERSLEKWIPDSKKLHVSLISVYLAYPVLAHIVPCTLIDVSSDERSFVPLIIHITRPIHLCHRYRGYDRYVPQAAPQKRQPPHSVFYSVVINPPEVPITTR